MAGDAEIAALAYPRRASDAAHAAVEGQVSVPSKTGTSRWIFGMLRTAIGGSALSARLSLNAWTRFGDQRERSTTEPEARSYICLTLLWLVLTRLPET